MKNYINRILCVCVFIFKTLTQRFMGLHTNSANSNILIICSGVLGDTLLAMEAVKQIAKKYESSDIFVVCRKEYRYFVDNVIDQVESCDNGKSSIEVNRIRAVCVEIVGGTSVWPDLHELLRIIKFLNAYSFYKVFIMHTHFWAYLIAGSIKSSEQSAFSFSRDERNLCFLIRHIKHLIVSNLYIEKDDVFIGNAYKNFMKINGIEYDSKGFELDRQLLNSSKNNDYKKKYGEYILLSPSGSNQNRSISKDMIVGIINELRKSYNYNIVISGKQSDVLVIEESIKELTKKDMENKGEIFNVAGRTDLNDFMRLVSQSLLVIGPDSGHIHLAASMKVPSIALCMFKIPPEFLPYAYDLKDLVYPKCVFSKKQYNCKYCLQLSNKEKKKYKGSHPNMECHLREREGKSLLCLDDITVIDVIASVESILEPNYIIH